MAVFVKLFNHFQWKYKQKNTSSPSIDHSCCSSTLRSPLESLHCHQKHPHWPGRDLEDAASARYEGTLTDRVHQNLDVLRIATPVSAIHHQTHHTWTWTSVDSTIHHRTPPPHPPISTPVLYNVRTYAFFVCACSDKENVRQCTVLWYF